MSVLLLSLRIVGILKLRGHERTLAEYSMMVDVLEHIKADPTREDAHLLAETVLRCVKDPT